MEDFMALCEAKAPMKRGPYKKGKSNDRRFHLPSHWVGYDLCDIVGLSARSRLVERWDGISTRTTTRFVLERDRRFDNYLGGLPAERHNLPIQIHRKIKLTHYLNFGNGVWRRPISAIQEAA
jgi:hypothetical protein